MFSETGTCIGSLCKSEQSNLSQASINGKENNCLVKAGACLTLDNLYRKLSFLTGNVGFLKQTGFD